MPNPVVPNAVWEVAETAEMREIVGLYGKTFHFWQVDRGDELPLGMPQLMMSFTEDEQVSGRGEDASFPIVLRCFHTAEARMPYAVFGITCH